MTDFIADLEAELVAAARRKAARRRRPLPRLRIAPIVVAAALAALAVVALRGLDGARLADEPALDPGGGVEVVLPLPAAAVATRCGQAEPRPLRTGGSLGVFGRRQHEPDGIPSVNGVDGFSWISATAFDPVGSRRPALPRTELHLIPVAGARPTCDSPAQGPGVCMVAGTSELARVRCFTDADIAAGRAIALTAPDTVHGIAPDGVDRVVLRWRDQTVTADVVENAYEAQLPGAREGDAVRVAFPRDAGCAPSDALYAAVPVLRNEPADEPPPQVEVVMDLWSDDDIWRRHSHQAPVAPVEVWVAPSLPCDRAAPGEERVCVMIVGGDPSCPQASGVRTRGAWTTRRVGNRLAVAGLAPPGMGAVVVTGTGMDLTIPVTIGTFGAVLPAGMGTSDASIMVAFARRPPTSAQPRQ